jgi:2,4-dienoyl-CoA reductase-like NADH-dependent reductase (Old Yellow Enzyme family)
LWARVSSWGSALARKIWNEIKQVSQQLIDEGNIDFLDISLWDVWKLPEEKEHQNMGLMDHFIALDRKKVKLTVAGKIRTGSDVNKVLAAGVDFVSIGRAAILHHDFAKRVENNPDFTPQKTPVTTNYLRDEGLGENFITYMSRWDNFVKM